MGKSLDKIAKAAASVKYDKTNLADRLYLVHSDGKRWGRKTRSYIHPKPAPNLDRLKSLVEEEEKS
jgi:hypothetical protein